MLEIQKEFIFYLVSSTPSMEALSTWVRYEVEKQDLMKKDYSNKIESNYDVLVMGAKGAGISVEEYKARQIVALRNQEIKKLRSKYGFDDAETEDEEKLNVIRHYKEMADKIKGEKDYIGTINKLFGENDTKDA